jgi:hypothetical protein
MNRKLIIFAIFVVLLTGRLWSQNTVTAEIYAEIISALTAQENQPLSFGRFAPEATGGSIVVNPDGSRLTQGNVVPTGLNHNPARFYVTGQLKSQFEVILPDGPVLLYREGGNETLQVTNFTLDNEDEIWVLEDGTRMINLGATLEVGSLEENPTGMYSGTYSIVFLYY